MTPTARIHPTARVASEAELSENVEVGPYCVIEGKVRLGSGCILSPRVHLIGPLTLGRNNHLNTGVVLGEAPQHLKYAGEPTALEIGNGNYFGERVTVHRSATPGLPTRIGNGNVFRPSSHVGHDSQVGDGCTLSNNALVGGHCVIGDGAHLGDHSAVHQFCRLGRLAILEPTSIATKDIPPFIIQLGVNTAAGVNTTGMLGLGLDSGQTDAMLRAFRIVYQEGLTVPAALEVLYDRLGDWDVILEFIDFVRQSSRGISTIHGRTIRNAA